MQETLLYLVQVSACRVNIEFFASFCEEIEPLSRLPLLPLIFLFFFQNRVYQFRKKIRFPRLFPPSPYFWKHIFLLYPFCNRKYSKVYRLGKFDIIRDFWRLYYHWPERWNPGWNNACKLQLSPFCLGKENFVCVSDPQKLRFKENPGQSNDHSEYILPFRIDSIKIGIAIDLWYFNFLEDYAITLLNAIMHQIVQYIHSLPFSHKLLHLLILIKSTIRFSSPSP